MIPKLQNVMSFIHLVCNASLKDPIAKMTILMLARLCNPHEAPIQINSPGVHHSISTYLALEHASQNAYDSVIKSTQTNFAGVDGVDDCLRFGVVEVAIAAYTGIEPIKHDMCLNLCLTFTGPFADFERCPMCNTSHWNKAKLKASHGCLKLPAKTFTTLLLGPQLQALYHDLENAHAMTYLQM